MRLPTIRKRRSLAAGQQRNDYYEPNKETLAKLIRGWADANDYIITNSTEAMEKLQKGHYSRTPLADIDKVLQGAEDVHFTRLEATLYFRRHGYQLVAADHRLLHGERQYQGLHASEQIF